MASQDNILANRDCANTYPLFGFEEVDNRVEPSSGYIPGECVNSRVSEDITLSEKQQLTFLSGLRLWLDSHQHERVVKARFPVQES